MDALVKLQQSLGKLTQFSSSLGGVQNSVQTLTKQVQTSISGSLNGTTQWGSKLAALTSGLTQSVTKLEPKVGLENTDISTSQAAVGNSVNHDAKAAADSLQASQDYQASLAELDSALTSLLSNSLPKINQAIGAIDQLSSSQAAMNSANDVSANVNLPQEANMTDAVAPDNTAADGVSPDAAAPEVAETVSKLQQLQEGLGKIKGQVADLKTLSGDNIMGRVLGEENITAYQDAFAKLKSSFTEQMALWPALGEQVQGLSDTLMAQMSPVFGPYIEEVKAMGRSIDDWAEKYPNLADAVTKVEDTLGTMIQVVESLSVAQEMLNLVKTQAIALSQNWFVKNLIINPLLKLQAAAVWILNGAMRAVVATGPFLAGVFNTLKAGIVTCLPAIWSFTAALLANPITWVVLGIVALIGALVAMVMYWDEVGAAIGRFADWVFSALAEGFNFIKTLFNDNEWLKLAFWPLYSVIELVNVLIGAFELIPQWWGEFQVWLGELSLMPDMTFDFAFIDSIKMAWSGLKNWLAKLNPFGVIADSANWIKDKFSWITGGGDNQVNEDVKASQALQQAVQNQANQQDAGLALPGAKANQANEQGGLFQSISQLFGGATKQSHVEKIEVNNYGQGVRGDELAHEMEMQVG